MSFGGRVFNIIKITTSADAVIYVTRYLNIISSFSFNFYNKNKALGFYHSQGGLVYFDLNLHLQKPL